MIILSIDTSQAASVALVDTESETVLVSEQADDQRRHLEFIGPALARVLAHSAQPELVATGIGPGPFTGLRVGIAAGIAVGQARGIPVRGLLSQAAIAEELHAKAEELHRTDSGAGSVLIAADARRREVYFSVYERSDASLITGPFVAKPDEVADILAAHDQTGITDRLGRGFVLYPEVLGASRHPAIVDPRAEFLAFAAAREMDAGRELSDPVPEYLREPDAKAAPARESTLK